MRADHRRLCRGARCGMPAADEREPLLPQPVHRRLRRRARRGMPAADEREPLLLQPDHRRLRRRAPLANPGRQRPPITRQVGSNITNTCLTLNVFMTGARRSAGLCARKRSFGTHLWRIEFRVTTSTLSKKIEAYPWWRVARHGSRLGRGCDSRHQHSPSPFFRMCTYLEVVRTNFRHF